MSFSALTARKAHKPYFFIKVKGSPIVLCEKRALQTLTVSLSGDLNQPSEYMRCYVNGTQIGGDLATGFQDDVFRVVVSGLEIQDIIGDNPVVELKGFGSAGVTPGVANNRMRFQFNDGFGGTYTYILENVENGLTVTDNQPILAQSISLMPGSIRLGSESINLETMSSTGLSGDVSFYATANVKTLLEKMSKENLYLQTNETTSSTSWQVNRTATNVEDRVLFVGSETIFCENVAANVLTVQRGLFDSGTEDHFGGSATGENLSTNIPGWTGRKVDLYILYVDEEDEQFYNTPPQLMRRFRVDDCPKYRGKNIFEFPLTDLSTFFIDRKAYVNMGSVNKAGNAILSSFRILDIPFGQGETLKTTVNSQTFLDCVIEATATDPNGNLVSASGRAVLPYRYDASGNFVEIEWRPNLIGGNMGALANIENCRIRILSGKQVYPIIGNPVVPILSVLTSVKGDLTNGGYDTLPGSDAPTQIFDSEWRLGAGIEAGDISITDFVVMGGRGSTLPWCWLLSSETEVRDILSWLCTTLRCFWYTDNDGNLNLKPFDLKYTTNSPAIRATLDGSKVLLATSDSTSVSEKSVAGGYRVTTNYSQDGEPLLKMNFTDFQTKKIFPEADNVTEIDMPFLCVDERNSLLGADLLAGYNPINRFIIETHIRRRMKMNQKGMVGVEVTCGWDVFQVEIGDYVDFVSDEVYLYGSSAIKWLVIGKSLMIDQGQVKFELLGVEQGRVIATGGEIGLIGGNVITFDATDPEWGGEAVTNFLEVGEEILVYSATSGVLAATIVAFPAANSIELSSVTGMAIGDYFTITYYGSTLPSKRSSRLFQCEDGTLGGNEDEGSRYN